jgi:AraC-like DNA-binding protein/mannose-6-phosphate isomerase-like protein (cupin superfamily)
MENSRGVISAARAITINSAARFRCAPDWSWDTGAGFRDYDLWVVLEGRGSLAAPGQTLDLARGDAFVLSPRTRYVANHEPSDPLSVIAVHFEADEPVEVAEHRRVVPAEFLAGVLERLLRAHVQGSRDEAVFWLRAALTELASVDAADASHAGAGLTELIAEIRERPGDRWEPRELAAKLGYSQQHFARLFRAATGWPPGAFVVRARVAAAQAYLRGSSLPIKRIAAILGYHDEFHFSNQFTKHAGVRPSTYRETTRSPNSAGT